MDGLEIHDQIHEERVKLQEYQDLDQRVEKTKNAGKKKKKSTTHTDEEQQPMNPVMIEYS